MHVRYRRRGAPVRRDRARIRPRCWARRSRTAVRTAAASGARPTGDVVLVHSRLAIIDPGPRGAQPMAHARRPASHRVQRRGLQLPRAAALARSRGERFTTGSDTEVLLRLLARDGPGCAVARARHVRARLVGRPRTRAARSRAIDSASSRSMSRAAADALAFASEIRALAASGLVRARDRSGRRLGLPVVGHRAAVADLDRTASKA